VYKSADKFSTGELQKEDQGRKVDSHTNCSGSSKKNSKLKTFF
jgi:hypothetical protein